MIVGLCRLPLLVTKLPLHLKELEFLTEEKKMGAAGREPSDFTTPADCRHAAKLRNGFGTVPLLPRGDCVASSRSRVSASPQELASDRRQ